METNPGYAEVEVPAEALSDDTSISATGGEETPETNIPAFQAQTNSEAASLIYTFGPEGQQFEQAVTTELRYDEAGLDESTVDIYLFDAHTGTWDHRARSAVLISAHAL